MGIGKRTGEKRNVQKMHIYNPGRHFNLRLMSNIIYSSFAIKMSYILSFK